MPGRRDFYRPKSHVAVAAPRRQVVKARRCALPIHREEAASKRRSESAKPEYQKVRSSSADSEDAPPGSMNRTTTIMPMVMRIPTSVTGSAILELEASLADASGPEADCELLPPDPFPRAVLGNAAFPERGTSGVTLVGTVVLGATAACVPALAAWTASPTDFEVEV